MLCSTFRTAEHLCESCHVSAEHRGVVCTELSRPMIRALADDQKQS